MKYFFISVILFLMLSCSYSELYQTDICEVLLPSDATLKQRTSFKDSGSTVYTVAGDGYNEKYRITIYPEAYNPYTVLRERYKNDNQLRFREAIPFDFGNNKGWKKEYKSNLLEIQSFCFNQNGYTIIIEGCDNVYDFKTLDPLIYSFKIKTQ